jgi:hypothetical protein
LFTQANEPLQSLEKAVQDQKAEWEKETKARAKERDDAKRDISGALEKLNAVTTKCSQDQESAVTQDIQQLFEKAKEMENNAIEMVAWRTEFDADQKKRFKEQDKKMSKKLDEQTVKFDTKIEALSTSVQEQLCTNQQSLQQILQDHREYLDQNLNTMIQTLQLVSSTVNKHGTEITAINGQMSATMEGPNNKRQKHSDEDIVAVEVMGNADTLRHNRDAHAPEPGGVRGR